MHRKNHTTRNIYQEKWSVLVDKLKILMRVSETKNGTFDASGALVLMPNSFAVATVNRFKLVSLSIRTFVSIIRRLRSAATTEVPVTVDANSNAAEDIHEKYIAKSDCRNGNCCQSDSRLC